MNRIIRIKKQQKYNLFILYYDNLLTKLKDLISFAPVIWFVKTESPYEAQEQLINDTDKSKDC